MLQCYNRGCGKTYQSDENSEDSCTHHPGEPFFHDAYKGWSCCNKKCIDFTEFLNIKGCTLSKHSNIKPPEPVKQEKLIEIEDNEPIVEQIRQPIRPTMERPPFNTSLTRVQPNVMPGLKDAIDSLSAKLNSKQTKNNPNEIEIGTACVNGGCKFTFSTPESNECICYYHPGSPIFHEGMKYWSCCQKKTTDFTAFMNQKGCASGNHKWKKDDENSQVVKCRYDWHQTGKDVIIAIYAKLYHHEKSTIKINPIRLLVSLVFPQQNDAEFNLDLELRGVIKINETSVTMYGSKIEITMPKAEAGSWSKLDFPITNTAQMSTKIEIEKSVIDNNENKDESDVDLDDIEPVNFGAKIVNLS